MDIQRAQKEIAQILSTCNVKEKHKFSKTSYMVTMTIAIELLCIFFIVFFYDRTMQFQDNVVEVLISMMAVMLSIITLFVSYFSIIKRRHQEDVEEEIESYSR